MDTFSIPLTDASVRFSQNVNSHSPVMKELIQKFETRTAENRNAINKEKRVSSYGMDLVARDAWRAGKTKARLDIDPLAVTSSSLSEASRHEPVSRCSFAKVSIGTMSLNESKKTGNRHHNFHSKASINVHRKASNPSSGDNSNLMTLSRSQSEISLIAGQGDTADNQTNNKDYDYAMETAFDTRESTPSMRNSPLNIERPASVMSRHDIQVTSNMMGGDLIQNEHQHHLGDVGKPERVSLRGLVKKQTSSRGKLEGRRGILDQETGQLRPHSTGRHPKTAPPPMPPGMGRTASNLTRRSVTRGPSHSQRGHSPSHPQKINVSPTRSLTSSSMAAIKDEPKQDISRTSISKCKPSISATDDTSSQKQYRNLTASDRYLLFLKRNSMSPKQIGSQESISLTLQPNTITGTGRLAHKPPKRELSMNRQGSNLTSRSKESPSRDRIERESYNGDLKNNANRRASSTRPKRFSHAKTKQRSHWEPKKLHSSTSVVASSSGSQVSENQRWKHRQPAKSILSVPKHQRNDKQTSVSSEINVMKSPRHVSRFSSGCTTQRTMSFDGYPSDSSKRKNDIDFQSLKNAQLSPPGKIKAKPTAFDSRSQLSESQPGPEGLFLGSSPQARAKNSGGGDKRTGSADIDSRLKPLTDLEIADTDLLPKHLQDRKSSQQPTVMTNPRDDYTVFASSSDEDSSYLSIEDQLKKIKAKRLLQMLQGSTLRENGVNYSTTVPPTAITTTTPSVSHQHGSPLLTDRAIERNIEKASGYTAFDDRQGYNSPTRVQFGACATCNTATEGADLPMPSPQPTRFTNNPFDFFNSRDYESKAAEMVSL